MRDLLGIFGGLAVIIGFFGFLVWMGYLSDKSAVAAQPIARRDCGDPAAILVAAYPNTEGFVTGVWDRNVSFAVHWVCIKVEQAWEPTKE